MATREANLIAARIESLVRELDALRDLPGVWTAEERSDFHRAGDEILSARDRLREAAAA